MYRLPSLHGPRTKKACASAAVTSMGIEGIASSEMLCDPPVPTCNRHDEDARPNVIDASGTPPKMQPRIPCVSNGRITSTKARNSASDHRLHHTHWQTPIVQSTHKSTIYACTFLCFYACIHACGVVHHSDMAFIVWAPAHVPECPGDHHA